MKSWIGCTLPFVWDVISNLRKPLAYVNSVRQNLLQKKLVFVWGVACPCQFPSPRLQNACFVMEKRHILTG